MRYYKPAWQLTLWPAVCNAAQHMRTRRIHGGGVAEIVMETAKRNMMEQLREKYLWKYGFSDMAKREDACGQIGGCWSGGPCEIMCDEIFFQVAKTWSPRIDGSNYTPFFQLKIFYGCQNDLQSWNPTFLGIRSPNPLPISSGLGNLTKYISI